jgi:hypothetical protein
MHVKTEEPQVHVKTEEPEVHVKTEEPEHEVHVKEEPKALDGEEESMAESGCSPETAFRKAREQITEIGRAHCLALGELLELAIPGVDKAAKNARKATQSALEQCDLDMAFQLRRVAQALASWAQSPQQQEQFQAQKQQQQAKQQQQQEVQKALGGVVSNKAVAGFLSVEAADVGNARGQRNDSPAAVSKVHDALHHVGPEKWAQFKQQQVQVQEEQQQAQKQQQQAKQEVQKALGGVVSNKAAAGFLSVEVADVRNARGQRSHHAAVSKVQDALRQLGPEKWAQLKQQQVQVV